MNRKTPAARGGRGMGKLAGFTIPITFGAQSVQVPALIARHLGAETMAALAFVVGGAHG